VRTLPRAGFIAPPCIFRVSLFFVSSRSSPLLEIFHYTTLTHLRVTVTCLLAKTYNLQILLSYLCSSCNYFIFHAIHATAVDAAPVVVVVVVVVIVVVVAVAAAAAALAVVFVAFVAPNGICNGLQSNKSVTLYRRKAPPRQTFYRLNQKVSFVVCITTSCYSNIYSTNLSFILTLRIFIINIHNALARNCPSSGII
jgi:hypothetical protein